ncbi:membrane protein [Neosynechococcus sphagnicola sy1]|uniref:GDT1 family protein n=1 Tax=Neosynechococcus sphagnicola sy1 TaxID=1497020 RepID=A0A098TRN7_9CYAN|nr:TMEM165/GDT1 family protein [Neosynechococcus sphagnicola]KGF73468.1 membrane protein [Neosynechococcus sphagnicola sy1]
MSNLTAVMSSSSDEAAVIDLESALPPTSPAVSLRAPSLWGIFASTFLTVFMAELGDKTQLATLLMSAESQAPWVVFAGAGSALVVTSCLGVLLGQWLAKWLSPRVLERAAGISLLAIALWLTWDVVRLSGGLN